MNKFIEKQLKNLQNKNINFEYNKESNIIQFKKYVEPDYKKGHVYIVKLDKILLDSTSVLSINFNKSTSPKFEYLKIEIENIINTMIQVNSLGYDIENHRDIDILWSGWLPTTQIHLIEEVK